MSEEVIVTAEPVRPISTDAVTELVYRLNSIAGYRTPTGGWKNSAVDPTWWAVAHALAARINSDFAVLHPPHAPNSAPSYATLEMTRGVRVEPDTLLAILPLIKAIVERKDPELEVRLRLAVMAVFRDINDTTDFSGEDPEPKPKEK